MTDELVFYTNPMSRGRIARWMLEEVGVPYRTVVLDYGTTMQAPEYLAINPMGKVPAITHGRAVVTEGARSARIWPTPFRKQASHHHPAGACCILPLAVLHRRSGRGGDHRQIPRGVVTPEKERMVGYRNLDAVVAALETAVQTGPYICGEQFTAADVYVGAQIGWGMAFGSLPRTPAFEAYSARLHSRPAAARAREIDDALLPEDQRGMM